MPAPAAHSGDLATPSRSPASLALLDVSADAIRAGAAFRKRAESDPEFADGILAAQGKIQRRWGILAAAGIVPLGTVGAFRIPGLGSPLQRLMDVIRETLSAAPLRPGPSEVFQVLNDQMRLGIEEADRDIQARGFPYSVGVYDDLMTMASLISRNPDPMQAWEIYEAFRRWDEGYKLQQRKMEAAIEKALGRAAQPEPPRLVLDDATRSVYLDGTLIATAVNVHPYEFFKTVSKASPGAWSSGRPPHLKGSFPKNLTRDVIGNLPSKLRGLIQSQAGAGYRIALPVKAGM